MANTQPTEPGPNAAAPLSGLAMKRRGPVAVWLGLPIITLGIYTFWVYPRLMQWKVENTIYA